MKVGDLVRVKSRKWTYGRRKFRIVKQFADGSFRLAFLRKGPDGEEWVERYGEDELRRIKNA